MVIEAVNKLFEQGLFTGDHLLDPTSVLAAFTNSLPIKEANFNGRLLASLAEAMTTKDQLYFQQLVKTLKASSCKK